jgi:hypothetical protein
VSIIYDVHGCELHRIRVAEDSARVSGGLLFASLERCSLSRALYRRLTVLCRLMDSAFARYYRTLGQFYESRLVHDSPTPDPSDGGANSVFTDNDAGGDRARENSGPT